MKHSFNFLYQTIIYQDLTQYSDFFLSYDFMFVLYLNRIIIFSLKNNFFNSLPMDHNYSIYFDNFYN